MLKHLLILMGLLLMSLTVNAQETVQTTVYYDVNYDSASPFEYEKLDRALNNNKVLKEVMLTGHTDSDGSNAYNLLLAKRRVMNVKAYLQEKRDVPISTEYCGEELPAVPNSNVQNKQQNRRVEVELVFEKSLSSEENRLSFDQVYSALAAEEQIFNIQPEKDTILILNQGTVIIFDKNTFSTAVNFQVKEVYSYADMIGERLSTTSNGRRLQTRGMLKMQAFDELGATLQPDKPITVLMPTNEPKEDMKLFYGQRDQNNSMNWNLAKDELHRDENSSDMVYIPQSILITSTPEPEMIPPVGEESPGFIGRFSAFFREFFAFQGSKKRSAVPRKVGEVGGPSTKELMDSLGVDNYEDLQEKLTEDRIEKGEASAADIGYYGFRSINLRWVNCDEFLSDENLITMRAGVRYEEEILTKLVFKNQRTIFPAQLMGMNYVFKNVPARAQIYHVIIKLENEKVFLSIVESTVMQNAPDPEFEAIELSDLKERLAALER